MPSASLFSAIGSPTPPHTTSLVGTEHHSLFCLEPKGNCIQCDRCRERGTGFGIGLGFQSLFFMSSENIILVYCSPVSWGLYDIHLLT